MEYIFLFVIILLFGCNNSKSDLSDTHLNEPEVYDNFKDQFAYLVYLENDTLNNCILYGKSKEDSISLTDFLHKSQKKFVLFHTPNSCMSCMDDLLFYLSDSINQKLQEYLFIISTGGSYRSLYLLTRKYNLEVPIFLVDESNLGINGLKFS